MRTRSTIQRKPLETSVFSENAGKRALPLNDRRPATIAQRKLQQLAQTDQQSGKAIQLQEMADQYSKNRMGLPPGLQTGVEQLSGYSMNDVTVHYNSARPAGIGAHAFTQGTDIHVAPGKEQHLPHEAWHVVQQKRGDVKPTMQLKSVAINDDTQLEAEADRMGEKALQPLSDVGVTQSATGLKNVSPVREIVQRRPVYVKKGTVVDKKWVFLRTDGVYDYYEDGVKEHPQVAKLKPTRDIVESMDMNELSDIEESDTELDAQTQTNPHTVYRVNSTRDSAKLVHQVLKPNPTSTVGVRVNGGSVFRLTGKDTQFTVQGTSKKALLQSDDTQKTGYMPARGPKDPMATGKVSSYEHVVSELEAHDSQAVAQAIYDRFNANTPYPKTFSSRAQAKMDELFVLLSIAETFRTGYAFALFTASIQALINGATLEEVLYKGKGQIQAWHVGASSNTDSQVSGQLMEQNMGRGVNNPHPTQPNMNLSGSEWESGLKRTEKLFDKASTGSDYSTMLMDHMVTPMGFNQSVDITGKVTGTRSPGNWVADLVVSVSGVALKEGDKVKYKGKDYKVKSVGIQWVLLLNA